MNLLKIVHNDVSDILAHHVAKMYRNKCIFPHIACNLKLKVYLTIYNLPVFIELKWQNLIQIILYVMHLFQKINILCPSILHLFENHPFIS